MEVMNASGEVLVSLLQIVPSHPRHSLTHASLRSPSTLLKLSVALCSNQQAQRHRHTVECPCHDLDTEPSILGPGFLRLQCLSLCLGSKKSDDSVDGEFMPPAGEAFMRTS